MGQRPLLVQHHGDVLREVPILLCAVGGRRCKHDALPQSPINNNDNDAPINNFRNSFVSSRARRSGGYSESLGALE